MLATVDPRASQESRRTAQAGLDNARAALGVLVNGPTDIKKQQDQQAIKEAQASLDNARKVQDTDNDSTDTDGATCRIRPPIEVPWPCGSYGVSLWTLSSSNHVC